MSLSGNTPNTRHPKLVKDVGVLKISPNTVQPHCSVQGSITVRVSSQRLGKPDAASLPMQKWAPHSYAMQECDVSPRRLDPRTRSALIDAAARLLAVHGPQAVSSRRVAKAVGTSTMALYTHFGGMAGLVREMVHEGFARLHDYLTSVRSTNDPVADMALLGRAYRHNALTNSHLYAVMFGGASLAGFTLTDEDRQHGRYTLSNVATYASRCIEAGRFRATDAELIANDFWIAIHGLVTLELGDYLVEPYPADRCFESQLGGLLRGVGDSPDLVARSLAISRTRFDEEIISACDLSSDRDRDVRAAAPSAETQAAARAVAPTPSVTR